MSTISQFNFSGGELAPALHGRVDAAKYQAGCKTLRNMVVMRSGGAENRAGTQFISETQDSTKTSRLIPFIFNSDQAYILEFGDQLIRFYRDGAPIYFAATATITNVSNQNPALVYCAAHGFTNGYVIHIESVGGMTELNGRDFKVANATTNTFTLTDMGGNAINSTSYGTYTSGGTITVPFFLASPYEDTDVFDIQYSQTADVMDLTCEGYFPYRLSRTSELSWSIAAVTLSPDQAAPTNVNNNGGAGTTTTWAVTAVGPDGEESLAATTTSSATPSGGTPVSVAWDTAVGAVSYRVFKLTGRGYYTMLDEVPGTILGSASVVDIGAETNSTNPSTIIDSLLLPVLSQFRPRAVCHFQQRLLYANSSGALAGYEYPETVWASRIGHYRNFYQSTPEITASDGFSFSIVGKQVNAIRHIIDLKKLVILTAGGEYIAEGDESGIVGPSAINIRQVGYNGAATLRPLIVGGNLLYLQARQSIIRDLDLEWQADGYKGNDLTIFSSHLFDGFTIEDWTYQQTPNSLVWACRDDGKVNGLTYIPEQQLLAWHRHDWQGGEVESLCAVPEGNEDALYMIIKRTINGRTTRYIERMQSRFIDDIVDKAFMDSYLTYDGRNTNTSHTMTVSGGTTWVYTEDLTLTSSTSYFASTDVGNEIHITSATGEVVRFSITQYTSGTAVTVRANKTVPTNLRSTARSTWSKAVDEATGLWHLEGESVSVFGDAFVVASPNNTSYTAVTVTNGVATLPACYSVIHVGIPYVSDLETLDIDTPDGETLSDKQKLVTRVTAKLYKTRGVFVGDNPESDTALTGLTELKLRESEGYDEPVDLFSGNKTINIESSWNSNGRIFLRQVDPLPMTVLSVSPSGLLPFRRG